MILADISRDRQAMAKKSVAVSLRPNATRGTVSYACTTVLLGPNVRIVAGCLGQVCYSPLAESRQNHALDKGFQRSLESSLVAVWWIVAVLAVKLGIPVKVNMDSGGKPNGIPERR
jgi:hypothetical protein